MISISGIKYQEELEKLPYFTKQAAGLLLGKEGKNLDWKLSQLIKKGYLTRLRNGLYAVETFLASEVEKEGYFEYLANILRSPSYLSLDYVLAKNGLIPEGVNLFTSITLKSPRVYTNRFGSFVYKNIKEGLFAGFDTEKKGVYSINIGSKAKALFDFLYLKRNFDYTKKEEIERGLRINWDNFLLTDAEEFKKYVLLSKSEKMTIIFKNMMEIKNVT